MIDLSQRGGNVIAGINPGGTSPNMQVRVCIQGSDPCRDVFCTVEISQHMQPDSETIWIFRSKLRQFKLDPGNEVFIRVISGGEM